jgi:hypothetical protein
MDWRNHPLLTKRRNMPAPELSPLPQIEDIPEQVSGSQTAHSPDEYINPDMLQRNGKTSRIDLFRREHRADHLN